MTVYQIVNAMTSQPVTMPSYPTLEKAKAVADAIQRGTGLQCAVMEIKEVYRTVQIAGVN